MTERYAVYFSPKGNTELSEFGEQVLARSSSEPRSSNASSSFSDQERWLALTKKPAHYGFHATLKAPFELADGQSLESFFLAAERFASTQHSIPLLTLAPRYLSRFMALTLSKPQDELNQFAFACVKEFESFRKPLSEADIKRRKQAALSARQETLLHEYGYPYVAEEFRFHMTLSDAMQKSDQDYQDWVTNLYETIINTTPELDQIAIYSQTNRDSAFIKEAEFPLKPL